MTPHQRVDRLAEFSRYLAALISKPDILPEGLIRHLLHVRVDDEQLTADELIILVRTILAAGYETTAHVISQGIFTLLRHHGDAEWNSRTGPDRRKLHVLGFFFR